EVYVVKIFHDSLATNIRPLIRALEWSVQQRADMINLSLGTSNPEHEEALRASLKHIVAQNIQLIAAHEEQVRWLPGALAGCVPVAVDWQCPRDQYRKTSLEDGRTLYYASGYPRPIPGVSPERNLKGLSFAVANVTGLLARERQRA